jgi:hypothetical protein
MQPIGGHMATQMRLAGYIARGLACVQVTRPLSQILGSDATANVQVSYTMLDLVYTSQSSHTNHIDKIMMLMKRMICAASYLDQ